MSRFSLWYGIYIHTVHFLYQEKKTALDERWYRKCTENLIVGTGSVPRWYRKCTNETNFRKGFLNG